MDSAFSSDVSSSCADSECRNVGRAGGATASAPTARSGHRLLSPGIRHQNSPGSFSNVLVSLPEIVEVVAANAATLSKQSTTPEQIAALLPSIQTMFARNNKVPRSCSRTRTVDASSHTPFVDPAVRSSNGFLISFHFSVLIFLFCLFFFVDVFNIPTPIIGYRRIYRIVSHWTR